MLVASNASKKESDARVVAIMTRMWEVSEMRSRLQQISMGMIDKNAGLWMDIFR